MKLISHIAIIFVISCCFNNVKAQINSANKNDEYVLDKDSLKTKDKISYNFEMGVKVDNHGNLGTFYKPFLSYQISPKFKINTGLMYLNSSINSFSLLNDYTYHTFSGNISQYYAFVEGQYQVNNKLTVGGSIFYDFISFDNYNNQQFLKSNSSLNNIGYSANFKYNVSKNISVEGEFRVGDNNNPFNNHFNSPFNNQFNSNYGNSPFLTW